MSTLLLAVIYIMFIGIGVPDSLFGVTWPAICPEFGVAGINQQAEQMFHRLIKDMADKQGLTETLKAEKPWEWIGLMNNIQACAREVVNSELIHV